MKVLKMIGLVFSKIFLVFAVILFLLSLTASYVLEDGISGLLIGGLSNTNVMTNILPDIQYRGTEDYALVSESELNEAEIDEMYTQMLEDLGMTEEELIAILESDVCKELIEEFVTTVMEDVTTGDASDFDIGQKVLTFVEENQEEIESLIGQPLPMEQIEKFSNSEEVNQFNEEYKTMIAEVNQSVPSSIKGAFSAVEEFLSREFRIKCLMLGVVLLLIIALLQWSLYKWIRTIGNTILGCGIFVLIINGIGGLFSTSILSMLNLSVAFNFNKSIIASIIAVGCGIVLLVVYLIIKKLVDKGCVNNKISQSTV